MTDNDPHEAYDLQDLRADVIRRHHDGVDADMTALEAEIDDLEDEVADLKATVSQKDDRIDDLETDKEAAEQLLDEFRQGQRDALIARIREANQQVTDADEVDVASIADADVDTLAWIAERLEAAAERAQAAGQRQGQGGVRSGERPDLTATGQGAPTADASDEKLMEIAEDMGMGDAYRKLKNGAFDQPEGWTAGAGPGGQAQGGGQAQAHGHGQQAGFGATAPPPGRVAQDGGYDPTTTTTQRRDPDGQGGD